MQIRRITPDELYKLKAIAAVAFEFSKDLEKEKEEKHEYIPVQGFINQHYGAFEDDKLFAGMEHIPYEVNFDGHAVMLSGIASVCTLPPYRRKGAVRECFGKLFSDLRDTDFLLSYLYPFSRYFYRKFGYENNSDISEWTIQLRALKPYGSKGSVEFLEPGGDSSGFREVYTRANDGTNLSVFRGEKYFDYLQKLDPYKDVRYAYLYRDENSTPKGHIIFSKEHSDGKSIMNCVPNYGLLRELYYTDIDGLKGLLDFALTFSSNYDAIRFLLPSDIDLTGIISERNYCQRSMRQSGMVRVLDVERILRLARYNGTGTLTVGITDSMCEWNDGVFSVSYENGQFSSITRSGSPDVTMDITTFSSLITGTYADIKGCLKPDLKIIRSSANFGGMFFFKRNHIADMF